MAMTTAAELKEIQRRGKARVRAEERRETKERREMGSYEADLYLPEILEGLKESAKAGDDPLYWYKFNGYAGGWHDETIAEIKHHLEKRGFKNVKIKNINHNADGATSVSVECKV